MRINWVLAISCIVLSCSKSGGKHSSSHKFLGTWVDIQHRADSLIVYSENERLILFDNSMAYRTHPNSSRTRASYTWQIEFQETGIIAMPYQFGHTGYYASANDYAPYPFTWIIRGDRFEIAANSFRPFLRCSDCTLIYERVQ